MVNWFQVFSPHGVKHARPKEKPLDAFYTCVRTASCGLPREARAPNRPDARVGAFSVAAFRGFYILLSRFFATPGCRGWHNLTERERESARQLRGLSRSKRQSSDSSRVLNVASFYFYNRYHGIEYQLWARLVCHASLDRRCTAHNECVVRRKSPDRAKVTLQSALGGAKT